jgi:hypothetical protein
MEPSQYSEDLVESLRDMASIIDESQGTAVVAMLSGDMFSEAADEIARLRHELSTVHDAIDTMEERCTAGIDRLQEEINELRFQVVALSIPKETYRG